MTTGSLAGRRILVTRPAAQAQSLLQAISAAGGEAISVPLIEVQPLGAEDRDQIAANERILDALDQFDIAIFVSSNAVRFLLEALAARGVGWPHALRCLAVGEASAARLREAGIECTRGEGAMNSEALLERPELRSPAGLRVLLLKGMGGRELLAQELRARGARVSECPLYRRHGPELQPLVFAELLRSSRIDTVLISSTEALRTLLDLLASDAAGTIRRQITLVLPARRTMKLAAAAGFKALHVAANATDAAMLEVLLALAHGVSETT